MRFDFRRSHRGFTLIELLVVVLVIALLAAVLLPAVRSMMKRAAVANCSSNLRAIGVAAAAYASDHNGDWPYFLYNYDPPQPSNVNDNGGFTALITLRSSDWNGIGKLWSQRYLSDWKVFYCPADRGPDKAGRFSEDWENSSPAEQWIGGSYAMRGYKQFGLADVQKGPVKIMNLGKLAMGTCTWLRSPPGRTALSYHDGIYPVLFGDGSVQQIAQPKTLLDPENPPVTWGVTALQRSVWFYFDSKR